MSEFLTGKSVLIVAKKLDVLGSLRGVFSEIGATDIHVASSANMAVNMLRMRPFDFCILESELGEQEKSGAQVIEEVGREGIRKATSAFLLILPESVTRLPRDSVEFSADTFVSKPLDMGKLKVRMEKLVKLKQAVYPVESLVDQGDYEKALKLIRKLSAKYASLELYLDRLKGQLLLTMKNYPDATAHFQRLVEDRDLEWAYLGWGICEFQQGQYADALGHFNRVLQRTPESIEAYEWISKVYRCIGKNREAQDLLEKAVKVLPTAASIQSGLGNVASENSSWSVATDAFRQAVKFARHSCHQHQNNYFGLARCLQTQLSTSKSDQSSAAQEEAVRVLEDVAEEYLEDKHIRFKSRLMTSETYKRSGEVARANSAAKHAFEAYQQLDDDEKAAELDNLLEGVEGTSVQDSVEEFKNDFNRRVYTETEWGRNNLKGMGLYRKGQFFEALCCFEKALKDVEGSPSILLNLVQAGHEVIKRDPSRTAEVLAICNERLLKMSIGALNSKQQERYRALSERRAELVEKNSH